MTSEDFKDNSKSKLNLEQDIAWLKKRLKAKDDVIQEKIDTIWMQDNALRKCEETIKQKDDVIAKQKWHLEVVNVLNEAHKTK